jgi:hypothetical protein
VIALDLSEAIVRNKDTGKDAQVMQKESDTKNVVWILIGGWLRPSPQPGNVGDLIKPLTPRRGLRRFWICG